MKLSVVMHTCREDNDQLPSPVLRMMTDAVVNQDYSGEVELIIVDLLWENRKGQVPLTISSRMGQTIPVLHIPDKSSPFKDRGLLRIATPKNTGLIMATGTHVVFTDDCQVIPENALSLIAGWAEQGFGCTMSYEKRILGVDGEDDRVTGVDQRGVHLGIPEGTGKVKPARDIGFLGGTMSMVPMETLRKVNGWDEMFDGSRQLEDADMIVRLAGAGQMMAYENTARIVEYECGAYGDVVNTQPVKCNGAYAQYVWGLGRKEANKLTGDQLDEAVRRMHWEDCIRYREGDKCWPHDGDCTKLGEPDELESIYKDLRLNFDITTEQERRDEIVEALVG